LVAKSFNFDDKVESVEEVLMPHILVLFATTATGVGEEEDSEDDVLPTVGEEDCD
jgi:hypothetical protein